MSTVIYISPVKAYKMQIPVRVQVKYAHDYCKNHNLAFSLPISESILKGDSYMLPDIHRKYTDIVVFSIGLLGGRDYDTMQGFNMKLIGPKQRLFHFTYENKIMDLSAVANDLAMIERYKKIERWCNPNFNGGQ